jgi:hypothetical protein
MTDDIYDAFRARMLAESIRDEADRNVSWRRDSDRYLLIEDGQPLAHADSLGEVADMLAAHLEVLRIQLELDAWIDGVLGDAA